MLSRWTKGFSAEGAVGRDVMEMLQEALDRKGSKVAHLSALVNDTVGTLMAKAISEKDCYVGLILGTGCCCCLYISLFVYLSIVRNERLLLRGDF